MWYYRIPDTANSFNGGALSRFTNQSRYDCIMWNKETGQLYGFELKSTKASSISFADRMSEHEYKEAEENLKKYKANNEPTKRNIQVVNRMQMIVRDNKKKLSAPSIKWHQINNLQNDSESHVICGFLLQFRTSNTAYFLPIQGFMKFWLLTDKKSINENDIMSYGGIILGYTQKKVKHTYDIDKLITTLEKGEGNAYLSIRRVV